MTKVNIREALNQMDKDTNCKYDLVTLYEGYNFNDEEKKEIAKMISDNEDAEVIYDRLSDKFGKDVDFDDDDISDITLDECDTAIDTEDYLDFETINEEDSTELVDDLVKKAFTKEQAEYLVSHDEDMAEYLAYGNADNDDFEFYIKYINKRLNEDTVKTSKGKWVNKGEEGTHGTFDTKKEADAQRKAMFASGWKSESFKESKNEDIRNKLFTEYQSKYTPDTHDTIYNEIKDKYNDETLATQVISSLENDYKSWFDESLKEDWRDGKFTEDDFNKYVAKMKSEAYRLSNSIQYMIDKHPEYADLFDNLVSEIVDIFSRTYLNESFSGTSIMTIKLQRGINADGFIIYIKDFEGNEVFKQEYSYGYNASYDKRFASPQVPYVTDIIRGLISKYNVNRIEVTKGKNVFKGTDVDNEYIIRFKKNYLSEFEKLFNESLKESVDNDTKELFRQVARDKVFSTHIYNHHPFSGAIELMDEVDKNGEGRKLKFTSRDEMNSKADELLDNGYISYTYKRSHDESLKESNKETLTETSYGGAYDILDDEYFTKEDGMEAANEVAYKLEKEFPEAKLEVMDMQLDNHSFYVALTDKDGNEFTEEITLDMRKIRHPLDLIKKYAPSLTERFIKQIKDYYSEM
nr:MAG TPA: hypothetical protein [Caudoviricetes sp.]